MSTVCWAGVGIDPETQGADEAERLNNEIDDMILGLSEAPFATIQERDGSVLRRYRFGTTVVTEVFRRGVRVGFGIEACGEREAIGELVRMQTLLNNWGADVLASVWAWSRMAPAATPTPVNAHALGTHA